MTPQVRQTRGLRLITMSLALLLAGCSGTDVRECALPPLAEAEVERIGRGYLDSQDITASFRAQAEIRVTSVGCHYEYQEAEKLDSFGVGFVVQIDRNGNVRGFHSTE